MSEKLISPIYKRKHKVRFLPQIRTTLMTIKSLLYSTRQAHKAFQPAVPTVRHPNTHDKSTFRSMLGFLSIALLNADKSFIGSI